MKIKEFVDTYFVYNTQEEQEIVLSLFPDDADIFRISYYLAWNNRDYRKSWTFHNSTPYDIVTWKKEIARFGNPAVSPYRAIDINELLDYKEWSVYRYYFDIVKKPDALEEDIKKYFG